MAFRMGPVGGFLLGVTAAGLVALGVGVLQRHRPQPIFSGDLRDAISPASPAPRPSAAEGPGLAAALGASETTVRACRGAHVAVALVDAQGAPKLLYVPDGAAGVHAVNAWKKALTALYFQRPTSAVFARASSDRQVERVLAREPNLMRWPGGVPLVVGNRIVGAIGVSGARSEIDERCAAAGALAVADRSALAPAANP